MGKTAMQERCGQYTHQMRRFSREKPVLIQLIVNQGINNAYDPNKDDNGYQKLLRRFIHKAFYHEVLFNPTVIFLSLLHNNYYM